MRVAVIGAGIGGSPAAAGLTADGHDVVVYEHRDEPGAVMTTQLPGKRVIPIPLRIPSRDERAFRDRTLLPAPGVEVVGPRYADWLNTRA